MPTENTMTNEQKRAEEMKIACIRIARRGLQEIDNGDFTLGQALVKTAGELAEGGTLESALAKHFHREAHEKVASSLIEIASEPSAVALEHQALTQKRAEAKRLLTTADIQGLLKKK